MSDPADIFMWRRLDERLTTSGQPNEEQLAAIRDIGVKHVINLALHIHPKALHDEAGSAAALGLSYHHIPVDFEQPTEEDYDVFARTMRALEGEPVHVHCIVNARVSAFLYRFRRVSVGENRARAEMESVWKPGGAWAAFIGDEEAIASAHRYRQRDY